MAEVFRHSLKSVKRLGVVPFIADHVGDSDSRTQDEDIAFSRVVPDCF